MTMPFTKFIKIDAFKSIHKFQKKQDNKGRDELTVKYGAKIKLHGTNAGIRIDVESGTVQAQSRSKDISTNLDNFGFARWLETCKDQWLDKSRESEVSRAVIFGEWAGKGIHKTVDAVLQLEKKTFFVFGVLIGDTYFTDPEFIQKLVPELDNIRVLPWLIAPGSDDRMDISFSDNKKVDSFVDFLNDEVNKIDHEDPFIKEEFNISAPGEGLVVSPFETSDGTVTNGAITYKDLNSFIFKAKGKRHMVQLTEKAVTKLVAAPANVTMFAEEFVTEARCLQGLGEVCNGLKDRKNVKLFLDWMVKDVMEESKDELEKMNLKWKDVRTEVVNRARKWYFS